MQKKNKLNKSELRNQKVTFSYFSYADVFRNAIVDIVTKTYRTLCQLKLMYTARLMNHIGGANCNMDST